MTGEEFLAQAQKLSGTKRITFFRRVGDSSLMVAGFWPEYVQRNSSLIGLDYYIKLGRSAYASIGEEHFKGVFNELALKFSQAVWIFNQISEEFTLVGMEDILKMYERWQQTRDPRLAETLKSKGVNVVAIKS